MSLLIVNPETLSSSCGTCTTLLMWCNAGHILMADVVTEPVIFGLFKQASTSQMILEYVNK